MDLKTEKQGNATVIRVPESQIDIGNSVEFRDALAKASEGAEKIIVLDMKSVQHIDSSGIGVLITFLRHIQDEGGELRLASCGEKVLDTLKTTRLDSEIALFDSVDEAVNA
ncbi:MAG: anti-sigma factor antagonist [Candidatus Hydrogenedentota bacterium]|nr:MAG: anti-sigma factor antagonist [Candidatus Hydrogenedentota bacterium]